MWLPNSEIGVIFETKIHEDLCIKSFYQIRYNILCYMYASKRKARVRIHKVYSSKNMVAN